MSGDRHPDLAGRRVLVVEDDGLIAMDVTDILQGWGCAVLGPVATSRAALKLIADHPPDAAVLDVNLNGETSEPVAKALRTRGRPFLFVTAYQRSHLSDDMQDAPVLNKPVDEKKLRPALVSLLRRGGR